MGTELYRPGGTEANPSKQMGLERQGFPIAQSQRRKEVGFLIFNFRLRRWTLRIKIRPKTYHGYKPARSRPEHLSIPGSYIPLSTLRAQPCGGRRITLNLGNVGPVWFAVPALHDPFIVASCIEQIKKTIQT